MTEPTRDPLLVERERTHGDFAISADYWRKCTDVPVVTKMPNAQTLALCMIHLKIARIICGDPTNKDHWDDIAGYAKLGAEACIDRGEL